MPSFKERGALKCSVTEYSLENTLKVVLSWQQNLKSNRKLIFSIDFDTPLFWPVNSYYLGTLEVNYFGQDPA